MKQGFTLIELIVVVVIIGILSAVALPQYRKAIERSYTAEVNTVVNYIEKMGRMAILEKTLDVADNKALCAPWYTQMGLTPVGNSNEYFRSKHFLYYNENCMRGTVSVAVARGDSVNSYPSNSAAYALSLTLTKPNGSMFVTKQFSCSGTNAQKAECARLFQEAN